MMMKTKQLSIPLSRSLPLILLVLLTSSLQAQPFRGCAKGNEYVAPVNGAHEKEVLRLVNVERKKRGLQPLTWNTKMARAARYHAADMAHDNYFDHASYDRGGQKVCATFTRIRKFGSGSAENIAVGGSTPAGTMRQWMNSPGHKRNILSKGSKSLGVGYYYKPGLKNKWRHYWVQNFSRVTTSGTTGGSGGSNGGGNVGNSGGSTRLSPTLIRKGWKGFPFRKVDAATYYPGNIVYLFSGTQYARWDGKTRRVGPARSTRKYWRGLPFSMVEAAFYWKGNNKVYLFSGTQYVRYDVRTNKVDPGYPKNTQRYWGGSRMFRRVDAVLPYPNGKVYFFRGNQYIRYDFAKNRIDPGYPKTINNSTWPKLSFRTADAAVLWKSHPGYFFKNGAYHRFHIKKESAY
ncbi:hemopexin repeat-containing protein [Microscilla marina]|uniref:SCP domain-containing protein n=1 Tax=Microscilla marina ATCC 23134 TaxID=313606 RepID=A2A065_MICM2|nr:hemopexin repeat-containing protein [Microscilla marina]EAY23980.1 conserved hypothetical protein, putative [Microscilla marina ATCC 23134]